MFKFAIILIMAFIAVSICAYASPIRHCSADVGTNGVSNGASLVVLDEPTTALDVTVQRQILGLILELKNKMNLSILFISHDLRIVFSIADKIGIMYAGKIVEYGPKEKIISNPGHPYTMGLMDSIPSFEHRKKLFNAIGGKAPLFSDLPEGCKFYPRCRFKIDRCLEKEPELENVSSSHVSRCIRATDAELRSATPIRWNY